MDRLLDEERAGPVYLRKGAPADYGLHAWVVMPKQVHMLITPHIEPSVGLRRLKGVSDREGNRLLGVTGQPFRQAESYDHVVRSRAEFERIEAYIIENPVRAGRAEARSRLKPAPQFVTQ